MFKKLFPLCLTIGLLFSFPFPAHSAESDPYLNCLCKCACAADNWDCSVVSCYHDPSNECSENSEGECYCGGYGCSRATINTNTECARKCEPYRESEQCTKFQEDYTQARNSYLQSSATIQALNDYQYRATTLYHYNWLKLTTAFVYENLSPPPKSAQDFINEQIKSIFTSAAMPELQDNATKAEIQASLLRLINQTDSRIATLRSEQTTYLSQIQSAKTKIKDLNCTQSELQPLPQTPSPSPTKLNDINPTEPRGMAISALQKRNVINGYDDNTYKPEKPINRAEFLKILMESYYPSQSQGSSCFTDVSTDWYAPYACTAKSKGIISGYPDGSFAPAQTINTVEALKIILETIHPNDISQTGGGEWWEPYWDTAQSLNILPQDITSPSQSLNRGQMAEMIYRAMTEDILLEPKPWEKDYTTPTTEPTPPEPSTPTPEETTPPEPTPTPEEELTSYTHPNQDYNISYPSTWTIQNLAPTIILFVGDTPSSSGIFPTVNIQTLPSAENGGTYSSPQEASEDIKNQLASMPNYSLLQEETLQDNSTSTSATIFMASYDSDGQNYIQWQIVLPNQDNSVFYAWAYTSPAEIFQTYLPTATQMLESFSLIID